MILKFVWWAIAVFDTYILGSAIYDALFNGVVSLIRIGCGALSLVFITLALIILYKIN